MSRHRIALLRPVYLALLTGVLAAPAVAGQEPDEEFQAIPWSQRGGVTQRVGYTDVSITYSRPVARGRTLFGGIVAWDRTWTPGADSATSISFGQDVEVEGRALPAGRYTIWMVPREGRPWTVIFSNRTDIFHSPYPGAEHDALRLEIAPESGDHMEVLAFYFPLVERDTAVLRMHWGETIVPLAIEAPFNPYQ